MGCGFEEFLEIKTRSFLPSVKDAQSHSFAKLSALSLNLIFWHPQNLWSKICRSEEKLTITKLVLFLLEWGYNSIDFFFHRKSYVCLWVLTNTMAESLPWSRNARETPRCRFCRMGWCEILGRLFCTQNADFVEWVGLEILGRLPFIPVRL